MSGSRHDPSFLELFRTHNKWCSPDVLIPEAAGPQRFAAGSLSSRGRRMDPRSTVVSPIHCQVAGSTPSLVLSDPVPQLSHFYHLLLSPYH